MWPGGGFDIVVNLLWTLGGERDGWRSVYSCSEYVRRSSKFRGIFAPAKKNELYLPKEDVLGSINYNLESPIVPPKIRRYI